MSASLLSDASSLCQSRFRKTAAANFLFAYGNSQAQVSSDARHRPKTSRRQILPLLTQALGLPARTDWLALPRLGQRYSTL